MHPMMPPADFYLYRLKKSGTAETPHKQTWLAVGRMESHGQGTDCEEKRFGSVHSIGFPAANRSTIYRPLLMRYLLVFPVTSSL